MLGASLLAIPLVWERPPANTAVRIPTPFLDYRTIYQPDNVPSSPLWNYSNREWNPYAGAASVWLKFQLPLDVLPVELTGGRLAIQVTGPLGRLEVFGLHREPGDDRTGALGGKAVSLHIWDQPVGRRPIPIDDFSSLKIGTDGCLVLGFAVRGPEQPAAMDSQAFSDEKPSYWRIEELSLELTGKAVEP